jgi:hypothetical protein
MIPRKKVAAEISVPGSLKKSLVAGISDAAFWRHGVRNYLEQPQRYAPGRLPS